MEHDNEEDTDKSSAVIVTGAPVSDSADEGHSSLIAAPPSTASVAASFRDDEVVAVTNATRVDVYFRTAYLLHYASIVILGLFVLQVTCFRAHARKQVCVDPRTSALNMTLPAEKRSATGSYRSAYPTPAPGLRQTTCTSLPLSIDGTQRQTDGRTDGQRAIT